MLARLEGISRTVPNREASMEVKPERVARLLNRKASVAGEVRRNFLLTLIRKMSRGAITPGEALIRGKLGGKI
jgi:hypothetical protein